MSERGRVISGLAAEVAFAVLPLLVVLLVVVVHLNRPSSHFFSSPEWSFGAAILFGQSLVKFVSGIARGGSAAVGPVALAIALILVFGLVPSLVVLDMTLQSEGDAGFWLQASQVVLFCIATGVYMLFGTVGEVWHPTRRAGHANES